MLPKAKTFWYLATPYSSHPGGIYQAFREACMARWGLFEAGVPCYSPIVETHPLALQLGVDPLAHAIWLPFDAPMMRAASGLIVVMMPGWRESKGMNYERTVFEQAQKPVRFMSWPIDGEVHILASKED